MLVIISLSLQRKKSSGTSTSLARSLVALFQYLKNFTAQEVALVVLTILTPFERTESSSLETNENHSSATKVSSFGLSMDGSEIEVDGVVAPVESNGGIATLVCVAEDELGPEPIKNSIILSQKNSLVISGSKQKIEITIIGERAKRVTYS